jgi:hypothetical protein
VERIDGAVGRVLLEHGGEELVDLRRRQAPEGDVGHEVPPVEAGEQVAGGVAPGEAVGPVRADEHDRTAVRLGEQLEGGEALGVGPVEVLEDDQGRPARRQRPDEVDRRPHPLLGRQARVPHGGGGVGALAHVGLAQGVEEELHGATDGARVGLAGEHEGAARGAGHQLLHEAGLADAGLPGDQGDGGGGRGAEEAAEAAEVGFSPDHDR